MAPRDPSDPATLPTLEDIVALDLHEAIQHWAACARRAGDGQGPPG